MMNQYKKHTFVTVSSFYKQFYVVFNEQFYNLTILQMFKTMNQSLLRTSKKVLGLLLMLAITLASQVNAQNLYGIPSGIQEGNILHCFNWKISDVKAELPNIAAAGFGSVQLSPLQRNSVVGSTWADIYRPYDFKFIASGLGTKEDLTSLCAEAEKYGIKIIVDVVANHVDGHGAGDHSLYHDPWWNSNNRLRWNGDVNYGNRNSITHNQIGGGSGYPDVNSEDSEVANRAKAYIEELKACGVKGIRWDAAKHIALPSEGCQFWATVTSVSGMYHYGEVLDNPGGGNGDNLMKEYTNYMSVTDNGYGNGARNNGGVPSSNAGWAGGTLFKADKVVYWGESHDTYANNNGESKNVSQDVIDRAYAIVGCRDGATALYFSRPAAKNFNDIKVGAKGSTNFTGKQVAEINKFRNAMNGKKEYYTQNNGVASLTREGGGAVIVNRNGSGNVSIANGGGYCPAGTYTDRVSGGTFTVTSTTISGNVGSSGIAVIYGEVVQEPSVTLSPNGGTFTTETQSVTATLNNATSGWYKIGDGAQQSFTGTTTFTIGSGMAAGESVTVSWSATGEDGTKTGSATFKKADPSAVVKVYYNNPGNWRSVNCYIYLPATDPVKENAGWPGQSMTKDAATGLWYYEVPTDFTQNAKVIFNGGSSQYPTDVPGQKCGLDLNGESMICKDNSTWTKYNGEDPGPGPQPGSVTIAGDYNLAYSGTKEKVYYWGASKPEWSGLKMETATGSDGKTYKVFKVPAGTTNVIFNTNGDADKTKDLTYTGEYVMDDNGATSTKVTFSSDPQPTKPVVSASPASGNFTESISVTLSVNPAATIYYTTDGNAPTTSSQKYSSALTFTETTTLKAFGVTSDGTIGDVKTFTYTKSSGPGPQPQPGDNLITDYYKVNPNGQVGTNRTVNMSFNGQKSTTALNNWTEADLVAQGVARDICQAFKGVHERPIVDSYALYAAYDNENLYLGVQYVYTVWDIRGEGKQPGESKPYNMDGKLSFAFDLDPDKSAKGITNENTSIWQDNIYTTFDNGADAWWFGSTKPGVGTPGYFVPNASGICDYTDPTSCKKSEVTYGYADGVLPSITAIYGQDDFSYDPELLKGNNGFTDLSGKIDNSAHTFYEFKFPLSMMGITADHIRNNGIGVMVVDYYGASAHSSLPYDPSFYDNVFEAYSQDDSSSKEKEDQDVVTYAMARIGKLKATGISNIVADNNANGIKVRVAGGRLYIESDKAQNVTISTVSGMTKVQKVNAGMNVIDGLAHGIYIINRIKVVL